MKKKAKKTTKKSSVLIDSSVHKVLKNICQKKNNTMCHTLHTLINEYAVAVKKERAKKK